LAKELMLKKINSQKIVFLVFFSVILQSLLVFFNGIWTEKGILFQSFVQDSSWHLAIYKALQQNFPPVNPNFSGIRLVNYNYFWDLFLVLINKVFLFNIYDLYFHIVPPVLSFAFAFVFYMFLKKIFKDNSIIFWSLFFCFLGSSFAFLIPLAHSTYHKWGESSFWVSQTFSMLLNQHLAVSLILFFTICCLLFKYLKENSKTLFLSILFLSIIILFIKVYAGVLILIGLGGLGLKQFLEEKKYDFLLLSFLSVSISFLFLRFLGFEGGFPFEFRPFWFLKTMIEAYDRVDIPILILREEYYLRQGNILGIALLRFIELIIFTVGNLGVRVVGFFSFFSFLAKEKKKLKKDIYLFFNFIVLFAFVFPLLFIQKGVTWNSIQFWYYILPIASIFTGLVFNKFLRLNFRKSNFKTRILRILFILTVFLAGSLTSFKTVADLVNRKNFTLISNNLLKAFCYIRENSSETDVLVLEPERVEFHSSFAYFFTESQVFLSEPATVEITLISPEKRLALLNKVFVGKKSPLILKQEEQNIKYLLRKRSNPKDKNYVDFDSYLKLVYSEGGYQIYEFY
jgi:hypothetical protein